MTQTTQLGAGFQATTTPDAFVASIVEEVTRRCEQAMNPKMLEMTNRINALTSRPATPIQVSAQPPDVKVEVAVPEAPDAPIISMDLSTLSGSLTRIEMILTQLLQVEKQPVTRTVIRDRDGNITSIMETRG
jgi:hypothetical protein